MSVTRYDVVMLFGQAVALASIIFMGYVFYVESVLGLGALYIEPNRAIASGELIATILGGLIVGITTIAFVWGTKKPLQFDDDSMPAPKVADKRLWS